MVYNKTNRNAIWMVFHILALMNSPQCTGLYGFKPPSGGVCKATLSYWAGAMKPSRCENYVRVSPHD